MNRQNRLSQYKKNGLLNKRNNYNNYNLRRRGVMEIQDYDKLEDWKVKKKKEKEEEMKKKKPPFVVGILAKPYISFGILPRKVVFRGSQVYNT